ncbi:MAG: hypothetical protein JWP87_2741 [Labilithrix sp.]|nr:hypothetical protein [Labilithrix sp.]
MHAARFFGFFASASLVMACTANSGESGEVQRSTTALASHTLTIMAPQASAAVSGTIDVVGVGPGFLNVEIHSSAGALLARVTPDADGSFSASVDTTTLPSGAQSLVIDGWDSVAGTEYTQHATASLTIEVSNGGTGTKAASCVDANGNGIRYFGAYTKNTQTNYDFDSWSGFHQDFLTSFINCDTWANAAASDWGFEIMKSQPPGENIQQVVCLSTEEDPSLQHVASGMYDAQIENVGKLFLKHDYPNAIIRVGHEFEGNWYPWGLWGGVNDADFAGFIAAFRRVATILKKVSPTFTIVWNPGCSYLAEATNSELAYPGDDVVDVIGVDCYDDNSGVDHLFNGAYGMNQWAQFAKSHGKPIALPEWGLMSGGDHPEFIQAMFDFMVSNNTFLQSYWDSDDGNTKSELSSGEAPNSGAKFLQTFGKYAQACKP